MMLARVLRSLLTDAQALLRNPTLLRERKAPRARPPDEQILIMKTNFLSLLHKLPHVTLVRAQLNQVEATFQAIKPDLLFIRSSARFVAGIIQEHVAGAARDLHVYRTFIVVVQPKPN